MLAVGYIRVSGDNQRDNHSLPEQRESIEKHCLKNNWRLIQIFSDVQSGEDADNREGLQLALKLIYKDVADVLVLYKQDRLSRSVLDAEMIKHNFMLKGKRLVFTQEANALETEEDHMLYQFKSIFGEYERKMIKKRCSFGILRKTAEEGFSGGRPPYGYAAKGKKMVPLMEEQLVLKRCKEMLSQNCGYSTIAKVLNQEGTKPRDGKRWTYGRVYWILNRPSKIASIMEGGKPA